MGVFCGGVKDTERYGVGDSLDLMDHRLETQTLQLDKMSSSYVDVFN